MRRLRWRLSPGARCCVISDSLSSLCRANACPNVPVSVNSAGGPGNAVERSNPLLNVAESCLEKWQAAVDWELRACVRAGGVVASNP